MAVNDIVHTEEYRQLRELYDLMYEKVLADGCVQSEVDQLLDFNFALDPLGELTQKIDMLIDIKNDELFPRFQPAFR